MRISLNPDDLQVTSFSAGPGGGVEPGDNTTTSLETDTESSRPSMYVSCDSACWTHCCGTYNGCTSPGYNC